MGRDEPKALMGFWLSATSDPFIDLFPVSEVDERRLVGWELVAKETDFPGWLEKPSLRVDLQSNPRRVIRPKDYGEQ